MPSNTQKPQKKKTKKNKKLLLLINKKANTKAKKLKYKG